MVNRIWQHHFGYGLMRTENDFGTRGARPTHPELLDYLATRFIESGWSIKSLHRLIMHSHVYQLASTVDEATTKRDPDNRLLAHFPRRRLDAEEIRDSLLSLGGNLDRSVGGPHPFPPVETWNFTQHSQFSAVYKTNRRSVYLMTQRNRRHPYLALFDGADTNVSTARRDATTVPTQSLFLMNDPLVHGQSMRFAGRLIMAARNDTARLKRAYESALGRLPAATEQKRSLEFLAAYRKELNAAGGPTTPNEKMAWAAFARTLFAQTNSCLWTDGRRAWPVWNSDYLVGSCFSGRRAALPRSRWPAS